jgi:hypothetical protein
VRCRSLIDHQRAQIVVASEADLVTGLRDRDRIPVHAPYADHDAVPSPDPPRATLPGLAGASRESDREDVRRDHGDLARGTVEVGTGPAGRARVQVARAVTTPSADGLDAHEQVDPRREIVDAHAPSAPGECLDSLLRAKSPAGTGRLRRDRHPHLGRSGEARPREDDVIGPHPDDGRRRHVRDRLLSARADAEQHDDRADHQRGATLGQQPRRAPADSSPAIHAPRNRKPRAT